LIQWYSSSTLVFLVAPVVSEHGLLPRAIYNAIVSVDYWKAYSLGHVVVRSSFQVWPQGQYSLHGIWIWHSMLYDLEMHSAQTFFVWSPVPDNF
jgi:hypothetical protein